MPAVSAHLSGATWVLEGIVLEDRMTEETPRAKGAEKEGEAQNMETD